MSNVIDTLTRPRVLTPIFTVVGAVIGSYVSAKFVIQNQEDIWGEVRTPVQPTKIETKI